MSQPNTVSHNAFSQLKNASDVRKEQDQIIAAKEIDKIAIKKTLDENIGEIRKTIVSQIVAKIDQFGTDLSVHTCKLPRLVEISTESVMQVIELYATIQADMKHIYNIITNVGIILYVMNEIHVQFRERGYTFHTIHTKKPASNYSSYDYARGDVEYVQILTGFEIEW